MYFLNRVSWALQFLLSITLISKYFNNTTGSIYIYLLECKYIILSLLLSIAVNCLTDSES